MSWHRGTLYSFDTETTGTNVFEDRIVSSAIVKLVDGQPVDQRKWLLDPGVEIPAEATNVHGITTAEARELGGDPREEIPQIADTVIKVLRAGFPLVVFNAPFDLSLLEVEVDRYAERLTDHLKPSHWYHIIDPLVLARGIDKNLSRTFKDPATGKGWVYKLPALCDRYKVPFAESHDAAVDAIGAAQLAIALGKKNPQVAGYAPEQLHTLQRTWHRANMSSLRAYFDKNEIEHDGCDGGFPMHTDLMSAQGVLVR